MNYLYNTDEYDFWLQPGIRTDSIISKIAGNDAIWRFSEDYTLEDDEISDDVCDEAIDFDSFNEDIFV